ncbi:hypothetical protein PE36_12567 [Moritella sp. PE36]|nr:hypothetical protein PE36_12567 [Moritella sp. PE36]
MVVKLKLFFSKFKGIGRLIIVVNDKSLIEIKLPCKL